MTTDPPIAPVVEDGRNPTAAEIAAAMSYGANPDETEAVCDPDFLADLAVAKDGR